MVNGVSEYQGRYGDIAARTGRPAVPSVMKGQTEHALSNAVDMVSHAWKAMDGTLGAGLRHTPEKEDLKPGFSAWPQPNWWNQPPKWLDSLPWWMEGYLQAKAVKGKL